MKKENFDFKYINHIYYDRGLLNERAIPSLLKCIVVYIIHAIVNILKCKCRYPQVEDICFFSQSINNKNTITPIVSELKCKNSILDIRELPWSLMYFFSIPYYGDFWKFYKFSTKDEKKVIRAYFPFFVSSPGYYHVSKKFFVRTKVKCAVFANDHSMHIRCLIMAARKMNVKTIYTQHASVTNRFPPLQFTYSFLDGEESFEKYSEIGNMEGSVFLCGSPRMDASYIIRKCKIKANTNTIGVALNQLDSDEKAKTLCVELINKLHATVIVRPHPATMNTFDVAKFKAAGILVSISSEESSFDFLARINVLIANESGIHLDAAIFGVPSVLFNFSDNQIMDWYGYINKGLIKHYNTYKDVVNFIERPILPSTQIVQYYYAAYQTKWDGKIGKLIGEFIDNIVSGNEKEYIDNYFELSNYNCYKLKNE